jgi:hypothetical protein
MENNVHLILRPTEESELGGIIKFQLGVYTMGLNRIYGTWGRFWVPGISFARSLVWPIWLLS